MKILSKKLSQTDISRRCAVGMKYFKKKSFPKSVGNKVDFEVKDESDKKWRLCCSTRNTGKDPNHPKHPKPVLIKDWIPFVRSKRLRVGDRVIIYEERDETVSMHYRIKVEKRPSPSEACSSHVMNHNYNGTNGSNTHNSVNESTATFQPSGELSPHLLNHDHHQTTAATNSNFDEEQTSALHSTSQDIACYKTERPNLSLSLELTLKPTMTEGQEHAKMQERELETIDFLGRFL